MSAQKPREIAFRTLLRRESGDDYVENLLESALPALANPADRGLAQELVFGVVRWQSTLDWLIARKTDGRPQRAALQVLLRLGLYQLFWLDRIPDHAAVHETVEIGRAAGFGQQSGFLNAVLRGYARQRDETRHALSELRRSDPATGASHPKWLCERWAARLGLDRLNQLLDWNNTPPPTFARLNTLKMDADRLRAMWGQEGVEFEPFERDWTGPDLVFRLKNHPALAGLPSFQQGGFYIQDPSTLLAVRILDPSPGETVLDACAAPGGKTTFIAQIMGNTGMIVAQDRYFERLSMIDENCRRLGAKTVRTSRGEGVAVPELNVQFDRILVDAPCSNTGVIRRRVDLRWRLSEEEIERLCLSQVEILTEAARILKPGGVLVYSTCSLEPEENGGVKSRFLATHPGFRLDTDRELRPLVDGVDGGYVARFIRTV